MDCRRGALQGLTSKEGYRKTKEEILPPGPEVETGHERGQALLMNVSRSLDKQFFFKKSYYIEREIH